MGRAKPCLFIFLLTIIMFMLVNSTIAMNPKGFTLRMIHRDSEESPFYNHLDDLMTPDERFQTLIDQSRSRARYIASQINPDVYAPVVFEDTYYYAASVGIGTFPGQPGIMKYYLLIDSGSDITWLQCDGATPRFYQDSPLYPWQYSQSYHPIPCRDPSPGCQSCNEHGQCDYTLTYASSAVTYGVYAQEKFTLPSRTRDIESFQLIMGCSLRQTNFTFGKGRGNVIAGILGLGRGEFSFVTQLGPRGESKFSYCFEEYRGRAIGNTYLSFGADARIEGQVSRTPIVRTRFVTPYYYLYLEGISVGGARVQIPRSAFQINDDRTGGCIIDSGAPLTTMYRNIFDRVAHSVDSYFRQFGMRRAGFPVIHACYEPRNGIEYTIPTITFHFRQAADFVVSDTQNLWYMRERKVCLAITRSDSNMPSVVFGALQQIDKRILYNIGDMQLSFADEECGRGPRG